MSYEEYFSEERKLDSTHYESVIYDDQWEYGKILLRSTGEVLAERPERWEVIEGKGGGTDELLIYDDKRIFITENCGRDRVLVYEAEDKFYRVYSPEARTLFAFIDGTKRYQLYVPSRTIDFLFDLPNVLTEEEYYELKDRGKLADDDLYVWAEELLTNYRWWVRVIGRSNDWLEAAAKSQGTTVDKLLSTDGAIPCVNLVYNSQTDEFEIDEGREFVWDFVERS